MQKDDLKSLITHIYENLLTNIDNQEDANKEQVTDYLRDAINVVESISNDKIDSIEHAKLAFDNAYKEIADKSISSYEHTNKRFEKLTKMHEETLISYNNTIDLPSITDKFNDIQSHMFDEVKKANDVITKLSAQVKSLEKDSNLDGLTKVFNRRALNHYLNQICTNKNTNNMHILILDLDDFKAINDTFGHIAGDKILIFIANILKKVLRDGDKVFRYGGEEFVLILNRITQKKCATITSRILEVVRGNRLIYKGESINVTMSIGGTTLTQEDSPDSVIARADKALYKAKNNGKNQMQMELVDGI